ncbi:MULTISPECIES: hypothetical protein [Cupriavidus]|jgi:hypothetical protein|nr:hypothetical protein [Cupriavidus pauculus]
MIEAYFSENGERFGARDACPRCVPLEARALAKAGVMVTIR